MNSIGILDIFEVAAALKTDERCVDLLASRGEIPATKINNHWIFLQEDLMLFIRARIDIETAERKKAATERSAIAHGSASRRRSRERNERLLEEMRALSLANGLPMPSILSGPST